MVSPNVVHAVDAYLSNQMNNFGPMYTLAKHANHGLVTGVSRYTLAPHGTVLVKAHGVTKWIPSAMSKELFEMDIQHGHLVKVEAAA